MEDRLTQIVQAAVERGASDVHFGVGDPPMIRVGGELVALDEQSRLDLDDMHGLVDAILSERAKQRLADNLAVNASYDLPGMARLRTHVYHEGGSIAAVLRIVPAEVRALQELGLPPSLAELALSEQGLVLVAGRSGSGRSTTLAAMVDHANSCRPCHIVTVEDPIEFVHPQKRALVHQREVGTDVLSFADGLRDVPLQDPDVILVGAMRDAEIVESAIAAAENGSLVLAPSDALNGPQAIERIAAVFIDPRREEILDRLAAVLLGVVRQQLVPAADGTGRVAACEVLVATGAVRNLIRGAKLAQLYSVLAGGTGGMQSMEMALADLSRSGRITQQTALEAAENRVNSSV